MGQLQETEKALDELGYQVLFISPDRPEKAREIISKADYGYVLLSDSKMEAAKAFGIAFTPDEKTLKAYKNYGIDLEAASGESHHLLPVPSVFVLDKDEKIRFTYVDPKYQVRIDPDLLLAAATAALK